MSRAFRNGKTLAYWSKNVLSRAPRSFESDLIKFSGKVWASRTASFRGQEIFPMMSGDAPRHTKLVSSKKNAIFFEILTLVGHFRDSSYSELVMYTLVVLCTVVQKLILWYLYSKLAFLAMKATLEVQKAVFLSVCVYVGTHFAQSWHSDCTKFASWLHKVCTNQNQI